MPGLRHDPATAVRELYERLPYPPPETDLDDYRRLRRTVEGSPRHYFHLYWPQRAAHEDLEVLVAGCGTSQAAKIAIQQPALRVTGIDVSEASLRCTESLRARYGLANLRLEPLALERAGALGKRFDLILCTGVLHHLADPDRALRALAAVLAPDGALHLMVYATYGRFGVYMMQEYCARLGIEPHGHALSDLLTTVRGLPAAHPLGLFTRAANDLTHATGAADALLNPHDRAFTVPQLYTLLDRSGLAPIRWFLQAPYLPQCGFAARLPHAARLAALPAREQHAAMELLRGTMITHTIAACRNDRPDRIDDADREDAGWLDAVPVIFGGAGPRSGARPAGSAAVLHHAGHLDADLELPIDAAQARLYAAIDGRRTIAEIIGAAGLDGHDAIEPFALAFFRRLWAHDQILVWRRATR